MVEKRPFLRKKRRKNQLSETGPFRLILKLMDGPLSFFDIYGWPPFVFEAYGWPFWRLGAIHKRKNAKKRALKLMDSPFLRSVPYERAPVTF